MKLHFGPYIDSSYDLNMRPTYPRNSLFLVSLSIVTLSASFAFAEFKCPTSGKIPEPTCHYADRIDSSRHFREKLDRPLHILNRQLSELARRSQTNNPAGDDKLQACQSSLEELQDYCSSRNVTESKDCEAAGKSPAEGIDVSKNNISDSQITSVLKGSNCVRAAASCYKNGSGLKGGPSREKIESACRKDIDEQLKRIGEPQDSKQRQEYERLKAAKEIYDIADREVFDMQAQCGEAWGKYYECLGQRVLKDSFTHSASGRTPEKFSISCIDRDNSFRECVYTANGDPRTEALSDAKGKITQPVSGSPAWLASKEGSCSGDCISSDGRCNTIMTAKHCGSISQAVVVDASNRPQKVGVYDCRSGSGDWQMCSTDRTISSKPQLLRTLDPTLTGDECQVKPGEYIKRCGPAVFEKMARSNPVKGSATGFSSGQMVLNRGEVFYDASSGTIYHNFMLTHGDSGAGIKVIDSYGNQDIVAAHAWSSVIDREGNGDVIYYQDFVKSFKTFSVSSIQLSNGTKTMDQFRYSTE